MPLSVLSHLDLFTRLSMPLIDRPLPTQLFSWSIKLIARIISCCYHSAVDAPYYQCIESSFVKCKRLSILNSILTCAVRHATQNSCVCRLTQLSTLVTLEGPSSIFKPRKSSAWPLRGMPMLMDKVGDCKRIRNRSREQRTNRSGQVLGPTAGGSKHRHNRVYYRFSQQLHILSPPTPFDVNQRSNRCCEVDDSLFT